MREPGDECDRASELEEAQREAAIAQARSKVLSGDWRVISATWCEADFCGERIPDARRQAMPGVRLCVDCQWRSESMDHRTRGW